MREVVAVMTGMRAMDDAKRGYLTRVGPLAKVIRRRKLQHLLQLNEAGRDQLRKAFLTTTDRLWSDAIGEEVSVLDALGSLTPGQLKLLRSKVGR